VRRIEKELEAFRADSQVLFSGIFLSGRVTSNAGYTHPAGAIIRPLLLKRKRTPGEGEVGWFSPPEETM
jgi:hypothetical protein